MFTTAPVGFSPLVVFEEGVSQDSAYELLRFLDTQCKQFTNKIKLSRKIVPQYLGSYLLEQEKIDQAYYEERQREMDKDNAERGGSRNVR